VDGHGGVAIGPCDMDDAVAGTETSWVVILDVEPAVVAGL
jgi:hypothetical protein